MLALLSCSGFPSSHYGGPLACGLRCSPFMCAPRSLACGLRDDLSCADDSDDLMAASPLLNALGSREGVFVTLLSDFELLSPAASSLTVQTD